MMSVPKQPPLKLKSASCFKYQQLNVAGSRERLVAFLYAWNLWGESVDREEHATKPPPEILVEATFLRLFGQAQAVEPGAADDDF